MSQITFKRSTVIAFSTLATLLVIGSGILGYTVQKNKKDKQENKKSDVSSKIETQEEIKELLEEIKPEDKALSTPIVTKEDETKTVLTKEEIVETKKLTEEKKELVYTNPYFPSIKLPYNSDWQFSTTTSTSSIDGLLSREITFKKNGIEKNVFVKLNLTPIAEFVTLPCGPFDAEFQLEEKFKVEKKSEPLSSLISKKSTQYFDKTTGEKQSEQFLSYILKSDKPECGGPLIKTNISNSSYTQYNEIISQNPDSQYKSDKTYITYGLNINVFTIQKDAYEGYGILANEPLSKDVDQLLKEFEF